MTIIQALLLSIVEGVTEFLPISSTGHLILASKLLHIPQTDFTKSYEIIIQCGAIAAVALAMTKKIRYNLKLLISLLFSLVPTIIVGAFLYTIVKQVFMENTMITVWSLIIGGIILIYWEYMMKEKSQTTIDINTITKKNAVLIGLGQAVSVIPGVSRAAATIMTAMATGLNRAQAVEYSFFLAVPTILAASVFDFIKSSHEFTSDQYALIVIGLIGSFITAWITTSYFIRYVRTHTLIPFGIYRILIAFIFLILTL